MTEFEWVAIAILTVVSSARLTRLAIHDTFPPIVWVRDKFIQWTDKTEKRVKWQTIAFCPYCASFWFTLAVILSGWLSDWHTAWWLINGSLAASYLAAIVMVFDGDNEEDED